MSKEYEIHSEITKEVLDSVQVGDLVKCNDWKAPYRVKGVSENYFVMVRKQFGQNWYSICEKKPWPGIKRNAMTGGMFHIGTDNWVFGYPDFTYENGGYAFEDPDATKKYLQDLETGETEISQRTGCPITFIAIKRGA